MSVSRHGIVVGVDGSGESDAAVRWAAHEAVMRDVPLTLLHVVAPIVVGWPAGRLYAEMPDWQRDNAQQVIDRAREALAAGPDGADPPQVRTELAYADLVPTLVAASDDAQLVVVGSQGIGALGRLLLGSVSTALLQHAHGPVAVVRSDDGAPPDPGAPVLVGIDGSPASEAATALAFDEAGRRSVDLVAVHVWSDVAVFPVLGMDWHERESQGEEALAERLAGWQERYPDVVVHRKVFCDKPAQWLLRESDEAQLVVVGSRGRGGFSGLLLGSVSSALAHSSKIPVIVVRPD